MDEFKIKIYPSAERDFKNIIDYLNTLSKDTALKYYDTIIEKISSLENFPNRCPYVRDTFLKAKGYRYLTVKNYYIFYRIVGDTVYVYRIIYDKQDYLSLL